MANMKEKQKNGLVSIITTILNGKEYFELPKRTVLSQDYENFEWIIVDNGSTDGSYEYLLQLASQDNRIKVVKEPRKGLPHARNRGLAEAGGEFICFLDADDGFGVRALSARTKFLQNTHAYGAAYSPAKIVGEDGRHITTVPGGNGGTVAVGDFYKNNFLLHQPLFRAEYAEGLKMFDEYPHESIYIFWYSLAAKGCIFAYVPECFVIYVVRSNSMCKDFSGQAFDALAALERYYFNDVLPLQADVHPRVRQGWVVNAYDFNKTKTLFPLAIFLCLTNKCEEAKRIIAHARLDLLPGVVASTKNLSNFFMKKIDAPRDKWKKLWQEGKSNIPKTFADVALNSPGLDFLLREFINRHDMLVDTDALKGLSLESVSQLWHNVVKKHPKVALFGAGQFLEKLSACVTLNSDVVEAIYDDAPTTGNYNGIPIKPSQELVALPSDIPVVLCTDAWGEIMARNIRTINPRLKIHDIFAKKIAPSC